jgi:hypothetical protein
VDCSALLSISTATDFQVFHCFATVKTLPAALQLHYTGYKPPKLARIFGKARILILEAKHPV